MLLQDYFKHDLVYRLYHIYYSVKFMLNMYIFLRNVTALQDLLNKIISNRDKLFMSKF